jgi:hypothetical protein
MQEIAAFSMNGPDEAINLVVFNAEGFLMNDNQMDVLQTHIIIKSLASHS